MGSVVAGPGVVNVVPGGVVVVGPGVRVVPVPLFLALPGGVPGALPRLGGVDVEVALGVLVAFDEPGWGTLAQ